jgi:hypothetical protein
MQSVHMRFKQRSLRAETPRVPLQTHPREARNPCGCTSRREIRVASREDRLKVAIPLCIYGDSASSRHDTRHRTQNRVPLLNGFAGVARPSTHIGSYQEHHTGGRKEASLQAGRNAKCTLRLSSDEATPEGADRDRLDNKSSRANRLENVRLHAGLF